MDERLKRLIAKREAAAKEREKLLASRKAIVEVAEGEGREDLNSDEDTEFRALTEQIADLDNGNEARGVVGLKQYDERIAELTAEIERDKSISAGAAAVRAAVARVEAVNEARTYAKGNGRSYVQDLLRHSMRMDHDGTSGERLKRHAEEVKVDPEFRALDRSDGTGGYAVPPLWLMSQFVELARAGRAYANLVSMQDLPPGTDSINVPKLLTGTSTAVQTADNAAVSNTDLTDTSVNAPVRTIAGNQDVALQLLDQSPINFDEIVFRDLTADYAAKLDVQVISGTGASGQVLGVRGTSGIETIAQTAVGVQETYKKIADAVQRVHTLRFMPPTVIVMHPRRWAFFLAASDTQGRPLVVPSGPGVNAIATLGAVASEQVVGQMHGLPVVTDPNIPTNLGGGTNEDVIHVLRASDLVLFESSIRTRVLPEANTSADPSQGSETLTVRLQVYGYVAFTAGRYPKSVVEIGGTGLVTPTF